jgi:hypothetical protein
MNNILRLLVFVTLVFSWSVATAEDEVNRLDIKTSLTGHQLLILDRALEQFNQRGLHVGGYKVSLYDFGDNYLVLFEDPNAPEGQRGSTSKMLQFEVELSADLEVLRSDFSR